MKRNQKRNCKQNRKWNCTTESETKLISFNGNGIDGNRKQEQKWSRMRETNSEMESETRNRKREAELKTELEARNGNGKGIESRSGIAITIRNDLGSSKHRNPLGCILLASFIGLPSSTCTKPQKNKPSA